MTKENLKKTSVRKRKKASSPTRKTFKRNVNDVKITFKKYLSKKTRLETLMYKKKKSCK